MTSSPDVHPEFGYVGPRPRLRRDLRVAFFSVLLGVIVGGGGVIALSTDHDRQSDTRSKEGVTIANVETGPSVAANVTPAATVADAVQREGGKTDVSKTDASRPDTASSDDVTRGAGTGVAPKVRRLRVPEINTGIAGLPLGHTDTVPAVADAPAASQTDGSAGSSSSAPPPDAAAAPVPLPTAAPKKAQRTARTPNPRRDEVVDEFYRDDERASLWGTRGYGRSARARDDADDDYAERDERPARRIGRGHADDDYPRRGSGRGAYPPDAAYAPVGPFGGLFGVGRLLGGGVFGR